MNTIIDNCKHCDKPIPTHSALVPPSAQGGATATTSKCSIVECPLCAKCEKCDYMICRSCDNKTSILKWVEVDDKDMYLCAKCVIDTPPCALGGTSAIHSAEQSYKSSR